MSFFKRLKGKNVDKSNTEAKQPPQESVGLFPLQVYSSTEEFDIDIIAVHGLGGHWENTWKDAEANTVWLRDFLPGQLRESTIRARVFSYGYDSSTAFSRSITDINDVADDLLDRIKNVRSSDQEKTRPIILIAHSLGGLVAKKAMITAWNQSSNYSQLLTSVRGLVFFGVPHRGADIAYWAGLPASLLDHTLVGFGGNTNFLNALKRASPTWREISIQFIERASPPLLIRTFFETERLGNILVVDKDSARLCLPNEQYTGIASSNHRSMCKFDSAESQRYSPVWMAIRDMAQKAIAPTTTSSFSGQEPMIITDMPSKTPNFFGRAIELRTMQSAFNSTTHGQNTIVLWGLSGFGKTQLTLQYCSLHSKQYTSKIWIDATTACQAESLSGFSIEVADFIAPNDTTNELMPSGDFSSPTQSFSRIKAWLSRDTNKRWLMIIDNVESLDSKIRIQQLIPQCTHGTVIITTTRSDLAGILQVKDIEIGKVDEAAGVNMFLDKFPTRAYSPEEIQLAKTLVRELDGVPLAVEQAALDLSKWHNLSAKSLQTYLKRLKKEYKEMMMVQPNTSEWCYDKNISIIKTFNILKTSIAEEDSNALPLLFFASFFAIGNVPVTLFDQAETFEDFPRKRFLLNAQGVPLQGKKTDIIQWWKQLTLDSRNRAIFVLQKYCCLKIGFDKQGIHGFVIQDAIRRWCQECFLSTEIEEWALVVAYTLGERIKDEDVAIKTKRFLPHIQHMDQLLFKDKEFPRLRVPDGDLCRYAESISLHFAQLYNQHKLTADARATMEQAINYESLRKNKMWMTDPPSLKRMQFLGKIYQDGGELEKAVELGQNLLEKCEEVSGSEDNLTVAVGIWLSDLRTLMMGRDQQRQQVLTASYSRKQESEDHHISEDPSSSAPPTHLDSQRGFDTIVTDEEYTLRAEVAGFMNEFGEDDWETIGSMMKLANFCYTSQRFSEAATLFYKVWQKRAKSAGSLLPSTLVLQPLYKYLQCSKKVPDLSMSWKDEYPLVLIHSLRRSYFELAAMLIEQGVEVNNCDASGNSALMLASYWKGKYGILQSVRALLAAGADTTLKNNIGFTALHYASKAGHTHAVVLLLDEKATNPNSTDLLGRSALFVAAMKGHFDVANVLLEAKNIDYNLKDFYDSKPLSAAIRNGHRSLVELLLSIETVDLESKDKYGRTPFFWAGKLGDPEIAKLLLNSAKKRGISGEHINIIAHETAGDKTEAYCDVCLFVLSTTDTRYGCDICINGSFCMCHDCFEAGARCPDSHATLQKRVDGQESQEVAVVGGHS